MTSKFGVCQWRRLQVHGARGARAPHFYKWLGIGAP